MPAGDLRVDLIRQIHEAALEPERWSDVMGRITTAVQGSMSSVLAFADRQLVLSGIDARLPAEALEVYQAAWIDRDDVAQAILPHAGGSVVTSQQALAGGRDRSSAVWNEFYLPRGFGHFLAGSPVALPEGMAAQLVVYRSRAQEPFDVAEVRLIESLLPHVAIALRTHAELSNSAAHARTAEAALHAMEPAVFLVDRSARVLFYNQAAADLMRDGDLRIVHGVLRCSAQAVSNELHQAAAACSRPTALVGPPPVALPRRSAGPPLVATVVPLRAQITLGLSRPASAAIIIRQARTTPADRGALLRSVFGLTAAESRLAVELCDGHSLEDVAASTGLRLETIRDRCKNVMAKCGVRRQAELVSVLLRGVLRP